MNGRKLSLIPTMTLLLCISAGSVFSQGEQKANSKLKIDPAKPWSVRIADSFIMRHPADLINDSTYNNKWTYDQGVLLEGLHQLYKLTKDEKYFNYIKTNIDQYVAEDGKIKTYKYSDFNIDNINTGRELLYLYTKTNQEKYKTASDTLRKQLSNQPRTKSSGFWHKKIYPNQMWLDGLYMGEPFYAKYSKLFNEPQNFSDIVYQFTLIEKMTRDKKTGLLFHAWDESRAQKWSDPATGRSPHFWSRAMGWYAMALVDVLDFIPEKQKGREEIIKILQRLSASLLKYRDPATNLWFQVTNLPKRKGNYLEASASSMFTYAFAKGANKGYLSKNFLVQARKSFDGIIKNLVTVDENGFIDLHKTCKSAGLGGNPYRDGSFEYYISEPTRINDLKGLGPFINAAVELEKGNAL